MPVTQRLTGVLESDFRADRRAPGAMQSAVQTAINNPEARISVDNVQQLFRNISTQSISTQSNTLRVGALVPELLVNYTLRFFSADVAPLANASRASALVTTLLTKTVANGQFTAILQSVAVSVGSVSLQPATASNGSVDVGVIRSVFVQSSYPSSQPTRQPSRRPSSRPSGQPSASPSFTLDSKWMYRLRDELSERYAMHGGRNARSIYSELMVEGTVFHGGETAWEQFGVDLRIALQSRTVSLARVVLVNGSDTGPSVEVICDKLSALERMADILVNRTAAAEVICDGYSWNFAFCGASHPHFCINCSDPCQQQCNANTLAGAMPFDASSCSEDASYLKFIALSTNEANEGGYYLLVFFSTLWGALIFLFFWNILRPGHDRVHSLWNVKEGEDAESKWTLQRQIDFSVRTPVTSFHDIVNVVHKLFAWSARAPPSFSTVFHSIAAHHRDLKVFRSRLSGPAYGVYTATHLICIAVFTQGLIQLQYPYDNGECAAQTSEHACRDVRAEFMSLRHICSWSSSATADAASPDPNAFQTSCFWNNEAITAVDAFRAALVAVAVLVPLRILVLEQIIKVVLVVHPITKPAEDTKVDALASASNLLVSPKSNKVTPTRPDMTRSPSATPRNLMLLLDGAGSMTVMQDEESSVDRLAINTQFIDTLAPEDYCRYEFELSPANASSALSRLVPRQQVYCGDDLFEIFTAALIRYRNGLPNEADQQQCNQLWALQGNAFDAFQHVRRDVVWKLAHLSKSSLQVSSDYFIEYLQLVNHLTQLELATQSSMVSQRLLWIFALDLLGLNTINRVIFQRRTYRLLHPRAAASMRIKVLTAACLLALNAVLIFVCWDLIRVQPAKQVQNWFKALLIAVFVDMVLVENMDNLWYYHLIPALCRRGNAEIKAEILRAVRACELGDNLAKVRSARSRKDLLSPKQPPAAAPAALKAIEFDASQHFFVSKQLIKTFPALLVSQVIGKFRLSSLDRIFVGPWQQAADTSSHANVFGLCTVQGAGHMCKLIATLPAMVQRLMLLSVEICILFLVSLMGDSMTMDGLAYFGLAVICLLAALAVASWMYKYSNRFHTFVDSRRREQTVEERMQRTISLRAASSRPGSARSLNSARSAARAPMSPKEANEIVKKLSEKHPAVALHAHDFELSDSSDEEVDRLRKQLQRMEAGEK